MHTTRALLLASIVLSGCAHADHPSSATHARPISTARPRLVVSVIVDQLADWALAAHVDLLDQHGAIRRLSASGVRARVRYAYAGTFTAPGHAATYTCAPPSVSNVGGNRILRNGRRVSAMDDGAHPVLGHEGAFASPAILRAEGISDALRRAHPGSRIVSISMKDRGAILPGGRSPDAAFWFDKQAGGFTTSTYYADAIPTWLAAWNADHFSFDRIGSWAPRDPDRYARSVGPDDASGEGGYGLGAVFPHDIATAAHDDFEAYLASPESTELLLSFVEGAVDRFALGADETPDLLAISISGTDYAGHAFGPNSWEFVDHLIRADRALGSLLDRLSARTDVAMLVTSDHGVAPLVETSAARGRDAHRVHTEAIRGALEEALDQALGRGDWIAGYVQPFVVLTPEVSADDATRARAVDRAITWLTQQPGVLAAFDVRDAGALRADVDPLRHAVGLSIPTDPPGAIFVVPSEWSVSEEEQTRGTGTSHGSPWSYDQIVPVIYGGVGVTHAESDEAWSQDRVGATLSSLLAVAPPENCIGKLPLPGLRTSR